jgi:hypothetical protein
MTVLVVAEAAAILLLGLLVAGLLRSHAEILRRLHELGAGMEPMSAASGPQHAGVAVNDLDFPGVREGVAPPRTTSEANVVADVAGVTLDDEAVVVGLSGSRRRLLAFLSSGCATCAGWWQRLAEPGSLPLPASTDLLVVTKGEDEESLAALRRLAPPDVPVVMSSAAWRDYAVPGSPFFLLVDGGRIVGEGSGGSWEQVLNLLGQAAEDRATHAGRTGPDNHAGSADRASRADRELMAAGVFPGDPRLYHLSVEGHS